MLRLNSVLLEKVSVSESAAVEQVQSKVTQPLAGEELCEAEHAIIKFVQRQELAEETK